VKRGERHLDEKHYEAALAEFQAALTYPANLNVGRSNRPAESHALYGKGRALVGLGRVEEAHAAWQQGAALPEISHLPETSPDQPRYRRLCKEALTAPP
jgi:tetratricopeptide (TPR) repeat protein